MIWKRLFTVKQPPLPNGTKNEALIIQHNNTPNPLGDQIGDLQSLPTTAQKNLPVATLNNNSFLPHGIEQYSPQNPSDSEMTP